MSAASEFLAGSGTGGFSATPGSGRVLSFRPVRARKPLKYRHMACFLRRTSGVLVILALAALGACEGQSAGGQSAASGNDIEASKEIMARPLPDVAELMHVVEAHQKASEATIRNYIYTSTIRGLKLDGHGDTRREMDREMEVFYIDGVRLERTTKRNGQPLSEEEQKKENERIDKAIAKARERRAKGDEEKHKDEISFARFLELGTFSNERRVMLRGRSTIALDYAGDPKAKTRNQTEGAVREMAGTVWVDEQDAALSRVEGHFVNTFKVGGGLVAYVAKDTSFVADSARVNGEVWLPSVFTAQGSMHVLLFFSFSGRVSGTSANYRRFKTGSTIVSEAQEVEDPGADTPHATQAADSKPK